MLVDEDRFTQCFAQDARSLEMTGQGFKRAIGGRRNLGPGAVDTGAMTLSNVLVLDHDGACAGSFPLGERAWEVGSHPRCDITVYCPGVASRALLIVPGGGTVWIYDLEHDPGLARRKVLPIDVPVSLGAGYGLVRRKLRLEPSPIHTEPLPGESLALRATALVQGRGREARAFRIVDRPVSLGTDKANYVALSDRSVSRFHCRIEPAECGIVVRDLDSTNGTWVDGARIRRSDLRPGALLRVGRTSFRVAGGPSDRETQTALVAASGAMLAVVADVDRFSSLTWPTLIVGETGVGKELVARALHDRSPRAAGPFVAINGGGLTRELIESELFGHERGAFTGAHQAHRGAFEQAHGGTLFIDEVAELPADLQTRLLRVLETWSVQRVGSETARPVDVRLVCATHQNLPALVKEGRFRADLYYRIHRLVIEIPPLRHRPDDIEPLAMHLLGGDRSGARPPGALRRSFVSAARPPVARQRA